MAKPYSDASISSQLSLDRTWRIRELSDLKTAVRRADSVGARVLLRALVCICYAHWEGYVRFAARKYLEHVALRKLAYGELSRQYRRNLFLPRLSALSKSKGSLQERCELVDQILDSEDKRFSKVNNELISTQSNLSSAVFADICLICGVDAQFFGTNATFIDVVLLKRRNAIAHGEETFVDVNDMDKLIDTTTGLMRDFGDELDNQAALKKYRAA